MNPAHTKIKGCPHCGGVAYLNSQYSNRYRSYFVFVKCDICGAQGKIYNSDQDPEAMSWNNRPCEDAINAWNMRQGEATPEEVEQ